MGPETHLERVFLMAEAETVLIQVPADPDYLSVVRSVSAHVATAAGHTPAEIADLRLAVNEAGGLLLRHTVRDPGIDGSGDLECRFDLGDSDSALRVVLGLRARDVVSPRTDDFGWTILSALVDQIVWRIEGPVAQVEILKRRAAAG